MKQIKTFFVSAYDRCDFDDAVNDFIIKIRKETGNSVEIQTNEKFVTVIYADSKLNG